jgi:hypothetical protein
LIEDVDDARNAKFLASFCFWWRGCAFALLRKSNVANDFAGSGVCDHWSVMSSASASVA